MPTYDYECAACGHTFEAFQSIMAKPIRVCPECARRKVKRLIGTGAGIIFKGSGFYQTDYRSDSYNRDAKKEKTEASSGSSESSTKKESSAGDKPSGGSPSKAANRSD